MTTTSAVKDFTYTLHRERFDEFYQPSNSTRITTNFANLARGESRQDNLRNALCMINRRFNSLANWDNTQSKRYAVELDIVSVDVDVAGDGKQFPSIEILQTTIIDQLSNQKIAGMVGNNFSSYVRDYDFSILLPEYNKSQPSFSIPTDFGDLHGKLFQHFINSSTYTENFAKLPVICLSVSDKKTYYRTANQHPILGFEYAPKQSSLTEQYFKKMGFQVRYFMPANSVAPLSFYFFGDLLNDYTNLELISTISTMETFQKIYRPEIYNANAVAGSEYQSDLTQPNYSLTQIVYDREERSQLATVQGKFAADNFIQPYQAILQQWASNNTF